MRSDLIQNNDRQTERTTSFVMINGQDSKERLTITSRIYINAYLFRGEQTNKRSRVQPFISTALTRIPEVNVYALLTEVTTEIAKMETTKFVCITDD